MISAEAKAAGFVHGLKAAGYKCSEAKRERFAPRLLRAAGYTCAEARAGGYVKDLKAAGYTPKEAFEQGCNIEEAKEAGYVEGLCEAGYTVKVRSSAHQGRRPHPCRQRGYRVTHCRRRPLPHAYAYCLLVWHARAYLS